MLDHVGCLDEEREVPKKITRKDRALSAPLLSRPKLSKPTVKEDDVDKACQSLLGRKRLQDQLPLAASPSIFHEKPQGYKLHAWELQDVQDTETEQEAYRMEGVETNQGNFDLEGSSRPRAHFTADRNPFAGVPKFSRPISPTTGNAAYSLAPNEPSPRFENFVPCCRQPQKDLRPCSKWRKIGTRAGSVVKIIICYEHEPENQEVSYRRSARLMVT
ncbi:uncharacterized protein K441DRAFT_700185 [Cenococcum geophilum 1.58]|uniref:uncharacterized protein n=1 Tax=Cenococcum geophilum 1.58 TaxID=794803 RepID=UPI00358DFBFF|nr:hypothetical protein K441DRAFT_700185 [Cenococcum geophilum 1.58]